MRRVLFLLLAISTAGLLAAGAGAIWLGQDRTGMLTALCKAGLPNFSRPSVVDPDDLGCVILSPRRRVSGILTAGFEVSEIISPDLRHPFDPKADGYAWYTCRPTVGCGAALEQMLDRQRGGRSRFHSYGMASVTVEGWVTETPGRYGHLGGYPAEFYVDQVVSVGPPPKAYLDELCREFGFVGTAECMSRDM